jgi:hypothetical protein
MRTPVIALLMALVVAASSCGRGSSSSGSQSNQGGPPPGNATSVVVTPATATVYQGMTAKFQAQVVGQSNQAVKWTVQDNFGTIDSTGLYTAPRDALSTGASLRPKRAPQGWKNKARQGHENHGRCGPPRSARGRARRECYSTRSQISCSYLGRNGDPRSS